MKNNKVALFAAILAVCATELAVTKYSSRIIDIKVATSNCTPPPNTGNNGGER